MNFEELATLDYFLLFIWFLPAVFFVFVYLFAVLEKASGKKVRKDYKDYLRQVVFLLFIGVATLLVDMFLMPSFLEKVVGDMLPHPYFRLVLFPFMVLIGAKLIGGTKAQEIKVNRTIDYKARNRRSGGGMP